MDQVTLAKKMFAVWAQSLQAPNIASNWNLIHTNHRSAWLRVAKKAKELLEDGQGRLVVQDNEADRTGSGSVPAAYPSNEKEQR